MKKYSYGLSVLTILVSLFFIIGALILPREISGLDDKCTELDVQWYRVYPDGSEELIAVPGRYDVPRGEEFVTVCTLPQIPHAGYQIYVRSSQQDIYIYVNDELRTVYDSTKTRIWGASSMSCNVYVDISEKDSGAKLKVISKSVTSYSGVANAVYIGTAQGIYRFLFGKYAIGVVVAILLLFLSIISLTICTLLQHKYQVDLPMTYAAWTGVIVSVEAIAESRLRQYYVGNMELAGSVSYMLVGLIPIAVALYINSTQRRRYEKWVKIFLIICFANFIINFILQILNIQDFLISMTRSYILFAISALLWVIATVYDLKKGYIKETFIPNIGIFLAYIMGIMEIVAAMKYYLTITGLYINIGMFFLLMAAIMDSVNQLVIINNEKREAIAANNAKSGFLANMSHEIRTPISAILGMNEMIYRESSEANIKKYSSDVNDAGNNLLEIINDILDFSKIESGKMEIVETEYSLSKMVRELMNLIKGRATDKNLKLICEVDENLPENLYGDDVRLKQVLLNLLTNAVKYTDKGSVSIKICKMDSVPYDEALSDLSDKINLHIEVKDTGIGIKPEDMDSLFQKFERLDLKHNRSVEGTGLGLTITSNLIALMHGHLSVESDYGVGSVFIVDIPQGTCDDTTLIGHFDLDKTNVHEKEVMYSEIFHAPEAHILVVDDTSMNIKVIKGLLKKTQMHVDEALSGQTCIEMCRKKSYDLILMDHMMPEMDGIETLNILLENKLIDCPVVALTANEVSGMEEMYISKGFNGYLSKPVKPAVLEATICEMLPPEKVVRLD